MKKLKEIMFEDVPNNYTAALSGIILSILGMIFDALENNIFLMILIFSFFIWSALSWIIGEENLGFARLKKHGIKAFICPCCKEDLMIIQRMFIWFASAAFCSLLISSIFFHA